MKDPIIEQEYDAILVIINRLIKWSYFIVCTEEILMENVAQTYVKKVFAQYRSPEKVILDRDLRFVAAFWETFLVEQRVWVVILTAYYL